MCYHFEKLSGCFSTSTCSLSTHFFVRVAEIFVSDVEAGSPAYEAGLSKGDVIVKVNEMQFNAGVMHNTAVAVSLRQTVCQHSCLFLFSIKY